MNTNNYEGDYPSFSENKQIEAKSNLEIPNVQIKHLPKKNRTLQFYKFLFYSMKMEIKVHEFFDLVKFSNQSEVLLWIISIIIFFNSPKDFRNMFVWIHLIHVVRGIIGVLIINKLPRSYNVVDSMKNVPEKELETKLFNDLVRDVVKKQVVEKMEGIKGWLIAYFILTFINIVFDVIDFLYILSNIDKEGTDNNQKVVLLSYLVIAFLYLAVDMAYIFWTSSLIYTFPPQYLEPINNAFSGVFEKLKNRFKIGKKHTDVREEAIQQGIVNINPIQNQSDLSGNVNPHQIEIQMERNENKNGDFSSSDVPYNYPSKNFIVEKYIDQKENHEERLD